MKRKDQPGDVFVHTFDGTIEGHKVNVTAEVEEQHPALIATKGWKLFTDRMHCKHSYVTMVFGMFSYIDICTKCGDERFAPGNPEV